jgi:hypothetical protein
VSQIVRGEVEESRPAGDAGHGPLHVLLGQRRSGLGEKEPGCRPPVKEARLAAPGEELSEEGAQRRGHIHRADGLAGLWRRLKAAVREGTRVDAEQLVLDGVVEHRVERGVGDPHGVPVKAPAQEVGEPAFDLAALEAPDPRARRRARCSAPAGPRRECALQVLRVTPYTFRNSVK